MLHFAPSPKALFAVAASEVSVERHGSRTIDGSASTASSQ
jgi:hypothetical protein